MTKPTFEAAPTFEDATRPVRTGEELDLIAVTKLLETNVGRLPGPLEISQFPRGHSNLTYLLRAGDREWVLRRPPLGNQVQSAHDMGREFRVLSHLAPVWSKAPKPVAYDETLGVYVMERVRGIIVRKTFPEGFTPDVPNLCQTFVTGLAELHGLDFRLAGLADFGKPQGYVERQVLGWGKRYQAAKTDEIPDMAGVFGWLSARIPAETEGNAAIVHNDWKYDNLVLDAAEPHTIKGVLDWEMSTLGDPLMDLGVALGYWVEAGDPDELKAFAFGPTFVPGSLTRAGLVHAYATASGRDVSNMLYFYVFALYKTAVVAQQIYARFVKGHTTDPRFAMMIQGVRILSDMAQVSIAKGSL